ncbi:hypothetical protein A7A08_01444 [Methyloligella halotolerans]|uniref:DUF2231 domain-containing protein n=1 Tax=Methyloligella halotolerans TaxID=1177755 RepID=A0A1E2RZ36_9HYPH|nr:DUF2231 domain-containing protein [Methyloligella halotolerans]ODA67412.1 hypothetical protein A7A08_01444 [Methyloligella halotolerans]
MLTGLIEPNLHPIFVHFAVALLFTGSIATFVATVFPSGAWRGSLQTAGDWMLLLGWLAALSAVIAGFDAYHEVTQDEASHAATHIHRNWALATFACFTLLGAWRLFRRKNAPSLVFAICLLAAAAPLTVTAWWGGRLVFHYGLGVQSMPDPSAEPGGHSHGDGDHHH